MNFFRKLGITSEPEEQATAEAVMPTEVFPEVKVVSAPAKIKKTKARRMPKILKVKKEKPKATFDAPEEKYFWVSNGPVLRNLAELKENLYMMSDEQYDFHTKRDGNDFAIWITDVFGEKNLAGRVKKAKDKQTAAKLIENYLG